MTDRMEEYLQQHSFDVIIMPHIFPAEILSHMKNSGITLPGHHFCGYRLRLHPFY